MRLKSEITRWQEKITELEASEPTPQIAEMLSDARNALRFVKARHEDMSKHKAQ